MTSISIFTTLDTSVEVLGETIPGSFETDVYNVLLFNEDGNTFYPQAYLDSKGLVTIGDGYNMAAQPFQTEFLLVASGFPGTYIDTAALAGDRANVITADSGDTGASSALNELKSHYTLTPGVSGSAWYLRGCIKTS